MEEERLLTVQAEDLVMKCSRQDIPVHSGFLDMASQSKLRQKFGSRQGDTDIVYYGGYDGAERVVMACLPYYMQPADSSEACDSAADAGGPAWDYFNEILTVIRASFPKGSAASGKGRPLSHSDYLGALMGLGIKRSVIGDIIVHDQGADIIVLREMADFLLMNFISAGKARISTEEVPLSSLHAPDVKFEEVTDTVASLRLDAVLASAFRMSREKAAEAVRQGLVFVDHVVASKPDMSINEGAELVIRHKGKVRLLQAGGRTRKDRINIVMARYGGLKGK